MWGAYFCMGAYKSNVVAVIKMGAYIHGVLISMGASYPDFTVCNIHIQMQPFKLYETYCTH